MLKSESSLILEGIEIAIKRDEVLMYLGYRGKTLKREVEETLAKTMEESRHLISLEAIYSQQTVKKQEGGIIALVNGPSLNIGDVFQEWQGSQYLGVIICTIGAALEDRVAELFAEEDHLSAVLLDSIGSAAVEALADEINYLICCREKGAGNKVGPRTSPGYGKWNLTEQKMLFSLLPAQQIKVQLNQQCMMIPRKSCSFCLGIGGGLEYRFNPCRRCGKENCNYRWSAK
ncbi:vitamin B12 dependent-methionine synthase activation domain-containing protein [Chloroflexota bacterium]